MPQYIDGDGNIVFHAPAIQQGRGKIKGRHFIRSLAAKTTLIFALPCAVLAFLLGDVMLDRWQQYKAAKVAEEMFGISLDIADLVVELQKERGLSVGYIGSGGKQFAENLIQQRSDTDQKVKELKRFIGRLHDIKELEGMTLQWSWVLGRLENIGQIRKTVDEGQSTSVAWEYYTGLNSMILGLFQRPPRHINDPVFQRNILPYHTLMRLGEEAGKERGLVNGVLSSGDLNPRILNRIETAITHQNALVDEIRLVSDSETWIALKGVLASLASQKVDQVRTSIELKLSKMDLLGKMQAQIGYGGFIHNFKNYVLRDREDFKDKALESLRQAEAVLLSYLSLPSLAPSERKAISVIERTFRNYRDNLKTITRMHGLGVPVGTIDIAVVVDDKPALNAMKELRKHVALTDARQWFKDATSRIEGINDVRRRYKVKAQAFAADLIEETFHSLMFYFIVGLVSIGGSIFLAVIVVRSQVSGIGSIVHTLRGLDERGDYTQHLKVEEGDELHDMAHAINSHMDRLTSAFQDINSTLDSIAAGTSVTPVKGEYPGDLKRLKDGINQFAGRIEAALINQKSAEEKASLLHGVAALANDAMGAKEAFRKILEYVCNFMGWPIGHVYLVSRKGEEKLIASDIWYPADQLAFSEFRKLTVVTDFRSGEGLPGRVFLAKEPVWIENVQVDDNFPRAEYAKHSGIHSGFGLPVMLDGSVVAVVEFFSFEIHKKNESMMDSLSQIGLLLSRVVERAEAREKLWAAVERAKEANQAKSDFMASMSHELRTPLNAILGFSQLLQHNPKEKLSQVQESYVSHIISSGVHLLELISDVLDLAKIEAGKISLNLENMPPRVGIESCLNTARPLAEAEGIKLIDDTTDMQMPLVHADPTRFHQILINLLSNAIKYNREEGSVTLSCRETGDGMLRISVTDTGIGIPPDMRGRVFEKFIRLGVEQTKVEGTGVGLAVTKQLVELMRGKIDFESHAEGTEFWFELPIAEGELSTLEVPGGVLYDGIENIDTEDSKGEILFIEKELTNLYLMQEIVEQFPSVNLLSASTGEQGLELAFSHHPKLIILDTQLTDIDSFDALARIRATDENGDITIIALTGVETSENREQIREAGFDGVLDIPLDVPGVMMTIDTYVETTS